MRKYRVKLVALGLALVAVGCSTLFATRIGDIKGNPREYDGKTVTVAGKVTASVSVFGIRYFKVDDGTGEIAVVTERAVPHEGDQVRVKGRVDQAFSIGDSSLVVIIEEQSER